MVGCIVALGCGAEEPETTPSIDSEICADVVYVEETWPEAAYDCDACCEAASFEDFAFPRALHDHCICGNPLPPVNDDQICSAHADVADQCFACCSESEFQAAVTGDGRCNCIDRYDSETCAHTVEQPDPLARCAECCLEHIYLRAWYTDPNAGFGAEARCTCG
jgi:hypothetical protein